MKGQAWLPLLLSAACLWAIVTILSGQEGSRSAPVPTGPPQLERLFPSAEGPGPEQQFAACTYASPIRVSHHEQTFILVTPYDGQLTALIPQTAEVAWSLRLPLPEGLAPFIVATPVQVKDKLVLAYQTRSTKTWQRVDHRVTVVDLNTRTLDTAYPELILRAENRLRVVQVALPSTRQQPISDRLSMRSVPSGIWAMPMSPLAIRGIFSRGMAGYLRLILTSGKPTELRPPYRAYC